MYVNLGMNINTLIHKYTSFYFLHIYVYIYIYIYIYIFVYNK